MPFDEAIDLLGLGALLDRSSSHLSGGERQGVAIGRALLSQLKLLLTDEPSSALNRLTKDDILPFLERLHQWLRLPVIYVSHDMTEIERLADHLVLDAGKYGIGRWAAERRSKRSVAPACHRSRRCGQLRREGRSLRHRLWDTDAAD